MLIETEKTPNPSTRKFLPGRTVMETGGRDFPTLESAEASPLAEALFDSQMVDGVYFGRDFVSVSAAPGVEWAQLEPIVLETLMDHFLTDAPLFKPGSAADIHVAADADMTIEEDPEDADIIAQIKELIETRVRPAVAQDGGDIVYRGYKDGHVFLALQGACSGCPSSTITLKNGIEGLIKHYVPEVVSVEAI
ncbi:NifU family protein [Sphingomicrobium astaxanthinifaciens]|uniref:NifU family protein n=1 Tax=Sphingomicrobium astaxanthinifaciens TaxID=1227949 RepID=UPI001FCB70ED|nr:NifU family protein [Sphingomicrobium astaxanthinifaciens]MCJ7420686.1 NifU family protein [Sphingomicrobium astaxanthinifaciens]